MQQQEKGWLSHAGWIALAIAGAGCLGVVALRRGEPVNAIWLVAAAVSTAFLLRFPAETTADNLAAYWWVIPASVGVRLLAFWLFGLYSWVWYYLGVREVLQIAAAVTAGSLGLVVITMAATGFDFPETLLLVEWLTVMAAIGGGRLLIRVVGTPV